MRLTSKGRYAVRAMLDLAFNSKGSPVRLQEISNRQAISLHYLEQLFRKLRTGKVVKSVRGPGGGYVLNGSMDEITIKHVLESVGENINPAKDISGRPSSGVDIAMTTLDLDRGIDKIETSEFLATKDYFQNLGIIIDEYLTSTSLGDLYRQFSTQPSVTSEAEMSSESNLEETSEAQESDTVIMSDRPAPWTIF